MQCGSLNQTFGLGYRPPGLPSSAPMGSGRRCKLSRRGPGRSPDRSGNNCIECFQNASGCNIFGSFGQHCNQWQNESQSRLSSNLASDLLATYAINIIHSRSNWQVNFRKVRNCGPLNFAALFGRTPRTCLRPTLLVRVA